MADGEKQDRCPVCNHPLLSDDRLCGECGTESVMSEPTCAQPTFLSLPAMRYQNTYVWLIFVSALDIFLTILVLFWWTGREVNPIADAIIKHMGFTWTIVFKFALIILVIVICEVVGRRDDRTGRRLAIAAVVISAIPVAYSFALLFKAAPPIDTTTPIQIALLARAPAVGYPREAPVGPACAGTRHGLASEGCVRAGPC